MNEKEIGEIRRRITPDKNTIGRLRGCYVTEQREILSEFNNTLALLNEVETEELLSIIKKTLSGTLGKNLVDIEFSTQQVVAGEEHKLLSTLRSSSLEDDEAVKALYRKIIDTVQIEGSYLILLAADKYDVFGFGKDGSKDEDSATVFTYFLCSICPIKLTKPALSYYGDEFHSVAANSVISKPELGFMFPAFDDRAANIYGSLLYTRDTSDSHDEFINKIFGSEPPMPADFQKETFETILSDSIADECDLDVVQAVHEKICTMVDEHKAAREREPLMISKATVKNVLEDCGVSEEHITAFDEQYDESFGQGSEIPPKNIINTKQFEVKTPDVVIKVNPERTDLVTTEIINGTKYIMIRAETDVTVNGVNINIKNDEQV